MISKLELDLKRQKILNNEIMKILQISYEWFLVCNLETVVEVEIEGICGFVEYPGVPRHGH